MCHHRQWKCAIRQHQYGAIIMCKLGPTVTLGFFKLQV